MKSKGFVRNLREALWLVVLAFVCALAILPSIAYADDVTLFINEDASGSKVKVTATTSPSNLSGYVEDKLCFVLFYRDGESDSWHRKGQTNDVSKVASDFSYTFYVKSSDLKDGRQWRCALYPSNSSAASDTNALCDRKFDATLLSVSVSGTAGAKGAQLDLKATVSPDGTDVASYKWQRKASGSDEWVTAATTTKGEYSPILNDEALNSTWRCVATLSDGTTTGMGTTFNLALLKPTVSVSDGCYNATATASVSMPSGVEVASYEWLFQKAGSSDWTTVEGESGSTAKLPVNDETLAGKWKVAVKTTAGDIYEGDFSLSYDSFAYDYTDSETGVSGSIVYKIVSEPVGSTPGVAYVKDGSSYSSQESSPALELGSVSLIIRGKTLTYGVSGIGEGAFKDNGSLYKVSLCSSPTTTGRTGSFAIGKEAFSGCSNLESAEVACAKVDSVGASAFAGCGNLESVSFDCNTISAIGDYAFSECKKLTTLNFADDLVIGSTDATIGVGVGYRAFENCSSLETVKLPAILNAHRKPDYYSMYGLGEKAKDTDQWFSDSGYSFYWMNSSFAVFPGMGGGLGAFGGDPFYGCSSLKVIDFKAGNEQGLFAYWDGGGVGLGALTTLESVVYEAAQPYYGDANRSLIYGDYYDVWAQANPTFYYAVDFYITQASAESADASGTGRYARVEYKSNTPTQLIQAGSKEAGDYEYFDASLYKIKDADGSTPNPQAVAEALQDEGEAGFEDARSYKWMWHLSDTQSRREGLSDSCKAYLVHVDDLSTTRLGTDSEEADQIGTMYKLCDQNLSQGTIQDSAFDYERYYGKASLINPDEVSSYAFSDEQAPRGYVTVDEGKTAWFSLGGAQGSKVLLSQITLYDGTGNSYNLADEDSKLSVSLQQYDTKKGTLESITYARLIDGPVLLTITPTSDNEKFDHSTYLQEWILVKGTAKIGLQTATASETATVAQHINADGKQTEPFDETAFSVNVSSADPLSTLLATSYAGLSRGAIAVGSSKEEYGFQIDNQGNKTSFSLAQKLDAGGSAASFSVSSLDDYAYQKEIGNISCDYDWGDTAILVNPTYVTEIATAAASYSYAMRAPILYTADDGTVDDATVTCLEGFKQVVVIGGTDMVPASALETVSANHGDGCVTRITGDVGDSLSNACSLSMAVAKEITTGDNPSNTLKDVAIVLGDGEDMPIDVAGALNFSGHRDGVTLAVSSTADAKRVAQYLKDNCDTVETVRVFGRTVESSESEGYSEIETVLDDCLASVWDADVEKIPSVEEGDTLEIGGVMFEVGVDNGLTALSDDARKWGTSAVAKGDYTYYGERYSLVEDYPAADKKLRDPKAVEGLTYTGSELTGVKSNKGYTVEGGVATDVGVYVATVTPKEGYTWKDGTSEAKTVEWSITKGTLKGGSITIEYSKVTYTGSALTPKVTAVKLKDGSVIPSTEYEISYANNIAVGTAMVTVKAKGDNLEESTLTAKFVIEAAENKGNNNSKTNTNTNSSTSGTTSTSKASSPSSTTSSTPSSAITKGTDATAAVSKAITSSDASQSDSDIVDGWKMFYAPGGNDSTSFVTMQGVSGLGASPLGASSVAVCCLAFCGAVAYSSRARKETDDILDETDALEKELHVE